MELIKNVVHAEAFAVADQVQYDEGAVNSLSLSQMLGCKMTLFAIAEGEGMSSHAAAGDAMAFVLEGRGQFTIDGTPNEVSAGEAIILPVGVPHSVLGLTNFKMLLVVVKEA